MTVIKRRIHPRNVLPGTTVVLSATETWHPFENSKVQKKARFVAEAVADMVETARLTKRNIYRGR
jgi:hypothetical protein